MSKVRSAEFGVWSPPWRSGVKCRANVKIIFNSQVSQDPICSQFWARVEGALVRCLFYFLAAYYRKLGAPRPPLVPIERYLNMNHQIIDAQTIATRLVANYLAVKSGEEVLIVVDPETDMTMPLAIASAAQVCGAEYTLAIMPTRRIDKATTCTEVIARGMEATDVYISMTRASGAAVYDERLKALLDARTLNMKNVQ